MLARNFFIMSIISVLALTGCPPKQNKKEPLRKGRTALSPTGGKNANGTVNSLNSANQNTVWVDVYLQDQQGVFALAQPSLDGAPADEQLGQVSQQPGNSGGMWFWGNVVMAANGTIDSAKSRIHIEIYDSNYGKQRADGSQISQLFIHIGPEQEGFGGVTGTAQQIVFKSAYNTIMLQGNNQGGTYSGTMFVSNTYTGNQYYPVGQFQVQSTGFFSTF